MTLSINRAMLIAVSMIALLVISGGGLSIWSSRNQARTLDRMNGATSLLRNHMEADMMHDAIRADVLSVLNAGRGGISLTETRRELADHARLLTDNVNNDKAYQGSAEVSAASASVDPKIHAYVEIATRIAALDATQRDQAERLLPPFLDKFGELEDEMAKISDAIEHHVTEVKQQAAHASLIATALIGLSAGASLAVILAVGVLGRRRIVTPLHDLVTVVKKMTAGDMQVHVPLTGRADELGELAAATLEFRNQLQAAEQSKAEQTELLVSSIGTGLSDLAQGDLLARIDADLSGPFAELRVDFNRALAALQETLMQVSAATGDINQGAFEIRQSSETSRDVPSSRPPISRKPHPPWTR